MSNLNTDQGEFEKILPLIQENVNTDIPNSIQKKLKSQAVRRKMIQDYGEMAFLDSKRMKFPVVDPSTGEYLCSLIYAAYLRASIFVSQGGTNLNDTSYYKSIREKAKELFHKQECGKQLNIKITEDDSIAMDLIEFTELIELNSIVTEGLVFDANL